MKVTRECPICLEQFTVYPREGRGVYCSKSCASKAKHGNKSFEERFWEKVKKLSPCWIWIGATTPQGYGSIATIRINGKGFTELAHRVAYELTYGDIPRGMFVCHTCDNRFCVNPSHLFLGTHQDNMQDMHQKGRSIEHTKPERHARGERQHLAKLTAEQVQEIRSRIIGKRGERATLAREFGISKSAMSSLLNGETWK